MRDARIRIGVFLWRGCGCRMCSFLVVCGCFDVLCSGGVIAIVVSVQSSQKWSSCCVRPANRGASHEKGSFAVRTSNGELFGRRTDMIITFPVPNSSATKNLSSLFFTFCFCKAVDRTTSQQLAEQNNHDNSSNRRHPQFRLVPRPLLLRP